MLDFLYHQCDTKIIVLLQYYYTYAFLFEVSLRFFVLSLLLLIMFLIDFHSHLYWISVLSVHDNSHNYNLKTPDYAHF